jgi:hypothetical protein
VLVERGARVLGDLTGPRIGVAPGALVKGNVRTDGEPPLVQPQRRAGIAQPLRGAAPIGPSPAAKVVAPPIKPPAVAAPPPAAPAAVEHDEEPEPPKREKAEAPPPVVPALGKHAKAKKKRRDG